MKVESSSDPHVARAVALDADLTTIDQILERLLHHRPLQSRGLADGGLRKPLPILKGSNDEVDADVGDPLDHVAIGRAIEGLRGVDGPRGATPPRSLRLGGAGCSDAFEEDRGRLVVGILRYELATKCLGERSLFNAPEEKRSPSN